MMGQVALVPGEVTNVREVGLVTRGCVVPGVMEAWLVFTISRHTSSEHLYWLLLQQPFWNTSGPLDGQFRAIFGQLIDIGRGRRGVVLEYIHLYVDLLCLWFTFINWTFFHWTCLSDKRKEHQSQNWEQQTTFRKILTNSSSLSRSFCSKPLTCAGTEGLDLLWLHFPSVWHSQRLAWRWKIFRKEVPSQSIQIQTT